MIKLIRPEIPAELAKNKGLWTATLLAEVLHYGNYENIPAAIKDKLIVHYRDKSIKDTLFSSSNEKCAFCECLPSEGGGYIQVEHFYPKSIFPAECFSWGNFLPSCGLCNNSKGTLDTSLNFILNPYYDDPSTHLKVNLLRFKPKDQSKVGDLSIQKLDLNSRRLIRARDSVLQNISIVLEDISAMLREFDDAGTYITRKNRMVKLIDLVSDIEKYTKPEIEHSFFSMEIISADDDYIRAKVEINNFVFR
ncbi:TPA: hypothetical protein F6W46_19545 [Citrobacter freundii]|nr:hypothetical protein [Citrobacter freundii]